ncbi:hypothetical protein JHK87_006242 [Glycine soja]|nr:hypothetical protein JHK87_006242 [Glycine soja]
MDSSGDENECVVGTISLQVESIYKPTNDILEHCHASNKNAIVSSSDENACVVRPFSPQVESIDDLSDVAGMNMISKLRERLFMLDSWFLQLDFLDMDIIGISGNAFFTLLGAPDCLLISKLGLTP